MTEARSRPIALGLALAIAVSSVAMPAGAIDPQAKSRQLFKEAESFANDGSFDKACPLYQAAHELNSTGGTALRAADCYEKVGKYDRALDMYRYIVANRATDKVPDRVKLAEGRIAALEKQLAPPPAATAQVPPPPIASAPPPPPPSRAPAYVAFGVGGAGIVVGAVTGVLAMTKISDIKSRCDGNHCLRSDKDKASATQPLITASTIGFIVGGAGVIAGTVLFIVRPGGSKTSAVTKQWIGIGPGSVNVGGTF